MKQFIKAVCTWLFVLCCNYSKAQVASAEYYVDNDPGYGKATPIAISGTSPNATINFSTKGLSYSTHVVGIRSKDKNGAWSLDNKWVFVKMLPILEARAPKLSRAEYYISSDPGYGKATPITINGSNPSTASFVLNITSLPYGTTVIGMRSQDVNGAWSLDNKWLFVKIPKEKSAPLIKNAEYYIDKDPGYGKGTAITLTAAQQIAGLSFLVDLTKVPPGNHTVGLRTMDANGVWSLDNDWKFHGGSGSLPLTLLSFTAQAVKNDEAQLEWTTVTETNTKQFTILRSKNGGAFDSIGVVAAAGNSTAELNYSFTDATPFAGINYYRLKMQDLDGTATYSNVEPVLITVGVSQPLSVYPNPAVSAVTVAFTSAVGGKYTVQLTDLTGKEIQRISGVSSAGINTVQLNVQQYAKGTYLITLIDEEHGKQVLKMNKQ